jgi:Arc/MetJ-type ribon-helix-helix transcriptional regulator
MGLDNVAVAWPRTGRFYDPVAPAEFVDFAEVAEAPDTEAPTAALAGHIANSGTVRATAYTELVDLLLGLDGVLYATEVAAEDEDPVIDPDGCAWIAGGLERFIESHVEHGAAVTFESVSEVLRKALAGSRLADAQLRWLEGRLDTLRDSDGGAPHWSYPLSELRVLARFYRRCADRGFAVYADS